MKLYSVWLIVLTMLMGSASAANVNFNGGAVSNCTLSGSTYNCSNSFAMGATDVVVIAGGYTVVMTSFSPSYNQGLSIAGSGALQTSGNLDLSSINPASVSTGGSTLTAGGSFKLGSSTTINGSVVAASINTNSGNTITGSVSVTGLADLGSAIKINGNVSAGSFQTNSPGTIGGSITSSGTVFIGSHVTVGGSISGTTITTNSPVTLNGAINASVSFTLASGSSVTGNITAPQVTLSDSGSTIKGNVSTTGTLYVGSSNTITGTVAAATLNMHASGATINGATTVSGDVDMESGSVINGDLKARNVTTHSGSAFINGNAAVNAIYIDWNNRVNGTITCTGALNGSEPCSCVSKPQSYTYAPTCGAASGGVPDHFQISHTGSALTCQPQTVSVTACANAACSAPHFTSNVDVTLQPGGKTFTISGGINSAATVESKIAGSYTLSASATGVTAAPTCTNTTSGASGVASADKNPCDMDFKPTGLKITAPNHVSMTPNTQITVEALTAAAPNQSCVPLVTGQTVNVDMACSFSNPVNAANVPVKLGALNASCGAGTAGATVSVPLAFNSSGVATAALEYADVGQVGLSASYSTSKFSATGNGSFIAAPARLEITATNSNIIPARVIGPAALATAPTTVFAKASEAFTLKVTAVNYNGNATRNFGKESTPSAVNLTSSINNPTEVPVANGTGTYGVLAYNPFPVSSDGNGSFTSTSANFSDVGYLKLSAVLKNDIYYLDQQIASFQTKGTQFLSRFVPDHFDVALVANGSTAATTDTMDCSTLPVGINPCAAGTRFTHAGQFAYGSQAGYTGQPFLVQVSAYNGATPAALTANYTGALAKVVTLTAMKSSNSALAEDSGAIAWSAEGPPLPSPAPTRFTFSATAPAVAGVGVLTIGSGVPNLPTFKFSNGATGPATFYLRAVDTDGVSSLRVLPNITVEPLLTAVTGRLLVSNGYGSPTSPLPVSVRAQYYMPAGYVFNSQVNLSGNSPVAGRITFSNCQNALDMGSNSCPAAPNDIKLASATGGLTLVNGKASFLIAAPTPRLTKTGSVDVQLKNAAGRDLFPFLPSTTGRETFGVYRSGPVIYTREVYN